MNRKKLVAHRGDNTHFPENSYAGIEAALAAGALYVEFDIQMNADQSLIVLHDTDFNRTADYDASVFDTTDATLKTISAHESKRFGKRHYPTPVSHLNEILDLFKQYPKAQAFVEIKVESLNHWGLTKVMDKLLAALKKYQEQVFVISFSEAALEYTKQNSQLRTGFVFKKFHGKFRILAESLQPEYLICPYNIIPKQLWAGKWQWMLYSINSKTLADTILRRDDVSLIETDDIVGLLGNSK